ncbi:tripartite tricarboxylate transporter substrate binding protein [Azohydromonas australica]|uniref:tripartite tricarboxylate transporter substrate binding protein n=1 Tax=Azohydromonas australica TaxID=364039 RepID=UPI000412109B|nr:tripartite tricarboxylate transporter substrate binding protein [Azohydromonas australica]
MKTKNTLAAAMAATLLAAAPAWAAWPDDKPIEVVVGFAPGGGTDLMARKLVPFVQKRLGGKAQFVVVNKPGAAGEIANTYVAKAKPDGYTLAVVNMPSFFFVPMSKKSQYQAEDFQLVARVIDDPTILLVRSDSKYGSLQSLVAASKQQPGSVSFGHNGTGTNGELAITMLSKAAGVQLNAVPYKGTAAQKTDLLGGHLDVALVSAGEVPELHEGAKANVRGLAQLTAKRSTALPQVPTATEASLSVLMSSERGFAAHKGVPADIVKRLEKAIAEAVMDPEFLAASTDDALLAYLPGAEWQKALEPTRKALQPLVDAQPKN